MGICGTTMKMLRGRVEPAFYFITVAVFISSLQLYWERKELSEIRALEILMFWFLLIAFGVQSIVTGLSHIYFCTGPVMQDYSAAICITPCWVAYAEIAIGILGVLSIRSRLSFRLIVIIADFCLSVLIGILLIGGPVFRAVPPLHAAVPFLLCQFGIPVLLISIWILEDREIRKLSGTH